MLNYIFRRLGYMLVTLFLITILGYLIVELPPGSYVETEVSRLRQQGLNLNAEQITALTARYGLDKPAYERFVIWASHFIRGDFGQAFSVNLPVKRIIGDRLGYTMLISVLSMLVVWGLSIPIGVYSATHRYTIPDYMITAMQFIGMAIPGFLIALILMVFAQKYLGQQVGGLFSSKYMNAPWSVDKVIDLFSHLWIPVIVLAFGGTAGLSRVMRANLLDVLNMQYIQTARAKGLKENTVIWKHAVRNSLHVVIMMMGGILPGIISGETITAMVLNMPTTGPMYFSALINQDTYLAVTFLVFLAILLLLGNLLADILLAVVDPRIRYE